MLLYLMLPPLLSGTCEFFLHRTQVILQDWNLIFFPPSASSLLDGTLHVSWEYLVVFDVEALVIVLYLFLLPSSSITSSLAL